VSLSIGRPQVPISRAPGLAPMIAFSVRHRHRHSGRQAQLIFEASSRRRTPAAIRRERPGLAISRELSRLLGGEIQLARLTESWAAVFTLYLPAVYTPPAVPAAPRRREAEASPVPATRMPVAGARGDAGRGGRRGWRRSPHIAPGDRILLIVENDLAFARALLDGGAHARLQGRDHVVRAAPPSVCQDLQRRHHPRYLATRHQRLLVLSA